MTAFRLNYLFYAGIILPTVVTLALFVFFVLCWRRQSARKAVLTKPYDPHGTMRRLGIPNTPPPPPVFLSPTLSPCTPPGGEDNAAYDMSRSPSAEANSATPGRPQPPPMAGRGGELAAVKRLALSDSPSADLALAVNRLAAHSRLDSGLSEPSCESPGIASISGGAGGGGSSGSRDRPQSRASHSSHSTDSEDSGFRSSRSGHVTNGQTGDVPLVLRRSRSPTGRAGSKSRGWYHKAATSSPDSDTEPSLPLTPTTLWSSHHPHPHLHHQHSHDKQLAGSEETVLQDGSWKYLQDMQHCPRDTGEQRHGALTCHHHSMTLAQVHTPHDLLDTPERFGFSVV